jgi:aspartate kinase
VLKDVFQSLAQIPIRMVSYGGSPNNISILVGTAHKEKALTLLNSGLFNL